MPKLRHPERTGLHLRVVMADGAVLGPGRAELLEHVAALESIAAAARAMGMSYRRAWLLLNETATEFGAPVIVAAPGGAAGGTARLTPLGLALAEHYRRIEALAREAVAPELDRFDALRNSPLRNSPETG